MSEKNGKEKKQSASFFKELGNFIKPYKAKYVFSVIISILGIASGIFAFGFAGKIAAKLTYDKIIWSEILIFMLLTVLCKLINAVFINLSTWISHKAAYLTLRDIRNAISEKLMRIPLGYFEENGSGRIKTMLADRIESMEKTLAHMLPELTANLLMPFICIIWMFAIDWRLSLTALVWILAGFSVTGGMMKGYEEKFAGQIQAMKRMNQSVIEYVKGIEVIKNFGRTDTCYKKYTDDVYGHAEYNVNWQKETQKYSALGMAIAPFSIFPILIGGLIFLGNGSLDAASFIMIILLSFGIFTPLMNAMNYFDQMASMGTDAKEIKQVLEITELKRGESKEADNFDIEFNNVGFSYKDSKEPALKNISFHIPMGTVFALVGPSGSGKSTVGKLLAGFWDCDNGEIRIGDKSINEYSPEALNSMISFVDQETFLYDMSVLENIRVGNPDAADSQVIETAKKAGCDGFIKALPHGYNTKVGNAGARLSGGEKQRISIVRAMMKNSPVMILDEATANTDPENEASVQDALSAAAKGKTLIVIAHRLSTVVHAQQIAFVDNGEIKAIGKHSELLEICPEYKKMWEIWEAEKND